MPYLTNLIMPVSANITGLPTTLDNVGPQLTRTNTLLDVTSADVAVIESNILNLNTKADSIRSYTETIDVDTGIIAAAIPNIVTYTNDIRTYVDQLEGLVQTIGGYAPLLAFGSNSNIPLFVNQGTLTHLADSVSIDTGIRRNSSGSLVSTFRVLSAAGRLYNLFGVSTSSVDQYIQIYDNSGLSTTPNGTPVGIFLVPANSNFSFDFNRGLPLSTGLLLANSVTPVDYNPGNSDLFITTMSIYT